MAAEIGILILSQNAAKCDSGSKMIGRAHFLFSVSPSA
jgi:hypothetical protein